MKSANTDQGKFASTLYQAATQTVLAKQKIINKLIEIGLDEEAVELLSTMEGEAKLEELINTGLDFIVLKDAFHKMVTPKVVEVKTETAIVKPEVKRVRKVTFKRFTSKPVAKKATIVAKEATTPTAPTFVSKLKIVPHKRSNNMVDRLIETIRTNFADLNDKTFSAYVILEKMNDTGKTLINSKSISSSLAMARRMGILQMSRGGYWNLTPDASECIREFQTLTMKMQRPQQKQG